MTILVTGASGFLGRHVLDQLDGQPIRALVRASSPALVDVQARQGVEVVIGDITMPKSLPPALVDVECVVHLAGHVEGAAGDPAEFMAVNGQGTENLARAALAAGVEHVIYSSSITVYGHVRDADEAASLAPLPGGYAQSKIHAEQTLRDLLPAQATILRLPLLLGAGATAVCAMYHSFRDAGRVILIGSGQAPWSVVAARDVARAIALCLARPETRGQTYNVTGQVATIADLWRTIGTHADCTRETRIPYPMALAAAALAEWGVLKGLPLTRDQVRAISRPLTIDGSRFAGLGFAAEIGWREALAETVAGCAETVRGQ